MDERRFRIYVSIIVGIFIFSIARVMTETNPIYSVGEPVFAWLNELSAEVALVNTEMSTPDSSLQSANQQLENENQLLREQLALKSEQKSKSAQITRLDVQGFRKLVWINLGADDGIRPGQTVIHNNSLYGAVIQTFDESAVVRTVLDPDFRATVKIGDQQGILKVDYGSLVVDLVPSKELAGKSIITDGLDGQIVTDINVGIADSQISDQADVFGSYNVLLPFSLIDVRFVEVIESEDVE